MPITKEQMVAFMPTEEAIRAMQVRYPVQSTFIMDQMMSDHSSAGWFLAGYLFGRDYELRKMGFEHAANMIAEGKMRKVYDA